MEQLASLVRAGVAATSDAALAALAGAGVLLVILALWRLVRPSAAARHAVLEDRIARLTEAAADADAQLDARLAASERAIADAMDRRLDASATRIEQTLGHNRAAAEAALTGLAERLGRIDAAQARLAELSGQIGNLERALGNKQARGALGEARLSDLLRDALPPDAFAEQAVLANGRRADAILRLPAPPGPIAIDAKFPLEAFLALGQAADAAAAKQARAAFARDVAKHVGDIAERYIVPGETADCALMFVPSEAVYGEIHTSCREVVEAAFRRRVYIVSPTTLWATLNTARAILKDARVREQSALLQQEAMALVADVGKLAGKAESARRRLALAESDLDGLAAAARAAERRGRRIAELDLDPDLDPDLDSGPKATPEAADEDAADTPSPSALTRP